MTKPKRKIPAALAAFVLAALAALAVVWVRASQVEEPGEVVRLSADSIEIPAVVNAHGFETARGMAGYHAVVWQGGRAKDAALFIAGVTDVQVLDAFEAMGAVPGNALDIDSWEERYDRQNPAADRVIAGPPVEVLVRLPGQNEPLPLAAVLDDPGGRGLEMRLGGHRSQIPRWRSGCVICLFSCPGSKVGNASYTIRDYVDEATRFRLKPGVLPADGTPVGLILRWLGTP